MCGQAAQNLARPPINLSNTPAVRSTGVIFVRTAGGGTAPVGRWAINDRAAVTAMSDCDVRVAAAIACQAASQRLAVLLAITAAVTAASAAFRSISPGLLHKSVHGVGAARVCSRSSAGAGRHAHTNLGFRTGQCQ